MLQTQTAYPITETNASTLHHISGIDLKTFEANLGWCATFSEYRFPRWMIVPISVAVFDMEFEIDNVSYP